MTNYTYEDYVALARENAKTTLEDGVFDKALKEFPKWMENAYNSNYTKYKEGKITETQFKNSVSAVVYSYYMQF